MDFQICPGGCVLLWARLSPPNDDSHRFVLCIVLFDIFVLFRCFACKLLFIIPFFIIQMVDASQRCLDGGVLVSNRCQSIRLSADR